MAALRIALDAHAIGQRLTGNEVYVRNLVRAYPALSEDVELIAYISSPRAEAWIPKEFETHYVSGNPFVRLGAELGRCVRRDKPDLLHVQYSAPLFCAVPIVVTVHDVSYLDHPEYFSASRATQLRITTRRTIRGAAKVITGSEFSQQRIAKVYGMNPDDIIVTPYGARKQFQPMNREAAARRVLDRLGVATPFILNVGDLHPRKNQIGLIEAFSELIRTYPELPHRLVLVGKKTGFAPRVQAAVRRSGVEDRVVFTEFVEDDILPALYNAADLFVFPSWYEGFGLPVIEAMACGRPVACSSRASLSEVAEGAALLFEPESISQQMRAMRDVLQDQELAGRLEKRSLQRAARFDWGDTARKTFEVYAEVAEKRLQRTPQRELAPR